MNVPLPLFVKRDGQPKRSAITCQYKCGNACFHEVPNTSRNEYFGDIVRAALSRRGMLKGSAGVVVAIGAAGVLASCGTDSTGEQAGGSLVDGVPVGTNFTPVAPNSDDALVVPEGYETAIVIRWGDPLFADAPSFDPDKQSAASQAVQFGFNNDFAALLPIEGQANSYLLVVNHEYTTEPQMFKGYNKENPSLEHYQTAIAAHGLSVVQVQGESGTGKLTTEFGKYNRRITGTTEFLVTGPAAGSALLKTNADPTGTKVLGTLNNCSGGVTPWGTVLSGEENINQYFANADKVDESAKGRLQRYGFPTGASERKWELYEPRFDLEKEPNEANRFGWVVEVDPWDASAPPIKHTALGRFKHEAATIHVAADGTVVAYMGDDERFDYMYKFVSSRKIQSGTGQASMRHNLTILDAGTLYVAKFTGDHPDKIDGTGAVPSDQGFTGTGQWIPLLVTAEDGKATSRVDGFTAEEVAVFTRLAADKVGATKMDRPEDFEASPKSGKVYVALTYNEQRGKAGKPGVDEANPRNINKFGQVLEIDDEHAGVKFTWNVLMLCGDPKTADTYFAGFDKTKVSPIAAPDNLAFDGYGNLWISTDSSRAADSNDGLFSVVLDGPNRGETKQFLTVPFGGETCGPIISEQRVTVCVQHPGERDDATAEKPASHWPDGGDSLPRPAVVSVWKKGGGRIGT
ncbi:PhoX family protein [Nocardia australiensis]|uniref:PhoX family protein n=1 Tax=Nocardia australiensis TaxID=2887191 RepID=UPI0035567C21